ncbi:MAG TPA: C2 family cysteine protease [Pirellulales bacterium]|jgi:hypothetical protein|nr:C2 family cysteine protease [Pirellulales bacterium]
MPNLRTTALLGMLLAFVCQDAPAEKKPTQTKPPEDLLAQVVEGHFNRWDKDHNGVLDLREVDRLIEDHTMRGRLAALVVSLRDHMTKKGNQPALPRKDLLRLVEERDFAKSVEQATKHLKTIDRDVFLPTDPDLATFRQGRLNDCYLLATVAAQVHRNPKAIREMIRPEVTGGLQVVFGNGQKIPVPPLTDSELLLGAKLDSRHGSWLAVLEKAYGIIRQLERAENGDSAARAAETAPAETLNFGYASEIISLLSGRRADTLRLGKSSPADQVHNLLAELIDKKRLVCAGTNHDKAPPGIVTHHYYAILSYDVQRRLVKVFNPWGNHFTPQGAPGTTHGYVTKNGLFTVPLDQFERVFSTVVYETNRLLAK